MRGLALAALVAAALTALTLPAAALAQSAGDEQYQDPFAPGGEQQQGSGGEQPATTAPAPAPAPSAQAPSAQATAPTADLPRTGVPAWPVALLGGGLVAMGIGVRLFLRGSDPGRWPRSAARRG
jgi:hypothetical protein